jgi:iron complex outermembrane receptor protein
LGLAQTSTGTPENAQRFANGPPPTQTGCLFITTDRFERDFSSTIASASVQYRFNERVMSYLGWSEGFKSGGFNQRYNAAPPSNAPISFDDETAESYEIGVKTDLTDKMRLNAAVFSTDYDDIQMTYRLGVVPLLFNAGAASIDGAELELAFVPTSGLQLDASVGYLDAEFDQITPPPFGPVSRRRRLLYRASCRSRRSDRGTPECPTSSSRAGRGR